jgi:hypothetical protein
MKTRLWFILYFAAALLPRLSPLLSGTVFADDFVHLPIGHLLSYRFLNCAELAFWQGLFGADYLLGSAPKIVGALYTAGLCTLLRSTLRGWSARGRVAALLPLVLPLHPIWNMFVAWNVVTVYVLSLLLIVLGYRCLGRNSEWTILGILLMSVGISGYQVHAGLLPALVYAELVLSAEKAGQWRRVATHRLLACAAALALYVSMTLLAGSLGVTTWGDRGVASGLADPARLGGAMRAAIANLATITQPLLSYYAGIHAAWRFWAVPFLLLGIATVLYAKTTIRRTIIAAIATIALPSIAAAVILPLSFIPTGPRVAAGIWLATLLAALPLLQRLDTRRFALPVVAALFVLCALPPTLTDAANRTRAWQADQNTLAAITAPWSSAGIKPSSVTINVSHDSTPATLPPAWRTRPVVMNSFEPVTPFDYSNLINTPDWYLRAAGFHVVSTQSTPLQTPAQRSVFGSWTHLLQQRVTVLRVAHQPRTY